MVEQDGFRAEHEPVGWLNQAREFASALPPK